MINSMITLPMFGALTKAEVNKIINILI